jgi:S-adenosylmethionine hydrolase
MRDELSQKPNLIVLLTDFGTRDYFVGAMKGAILSINPNVRIIDLTHEIAPQDIRSASFTLSACYRDFPPKTIFTAVVDPGVGSARRAILVETDRYYFIAPDNGLLGFVFDEACRPPVKNSRNALAPDLSGAGALRVFELTERRFWARNISASFHGRDIFAPVAAHLAGGAGAAEFGREIRDFVRFDENRPQKTGENEITAEIVAIDRFGNLITNLKPEDLPAGFVLELGAVRLENFRTFFAEAATGEVFMIFGSAGFLEIAAFQNSAARLLNAQTGQKITVKSR